MVFFFSLPLLSSSYGCCISLHSYRSLLWCFNNRYECCCMLIISAAGTYYHMVSSQLWMFLYVLYTTHKYYGMHLIQSGMLCFLYIMSFSAVESDRVKSIGDLNVAGRVFRRRLKKMWIELVQKGLEVLGLSRQGGKEHAAWRANLRWTIPTTHATRAGSRSAGAPGWLEIITQTI